MLALLLIVALLGLATNASQIIVEQNFRDSTVRAYDIKLWTITGAKNGITRTQCGKFNMVGGNDAFGAGA